MAKIPMPSVSFIVARSRSSHVIGCENQLPWRLKSDLNRFKNLTTNHAVIMGRKTFESIGRRLPNRLNIILSRNSNPESNLSETSMSKEGLAFVKNPSNALLLADKYSLYHDVSDIFIIGGEEIYNVFLKLVNTVFLTEVYAEVEGDAFFKLGFDKHNWKKVEEEFVAKNQFDEYDADFLRYEKTKRNIRFRNIDIDDEDYVFLSRASKISHNIKAIDYHIKSYNKIRQRKIAFD